MRYVLWQRAHSPTSIVGSITAANLVDAANTARAMCDGSFYVVEWDRASLDARTIAECMDRLADRREEATV